MRHELRGCVMEEDLRQREQQAIYDMHSQDTIDYFIKEKNEIE